jgi:hypothetical protein
MQLVALQAKKKEKKYLRAPADELLSDKESLSPQTLQVLVQRTS